MPSSSIRAPFLAIVRRALGRPLRDTEVETIDSAFDTTMPVSPGCTSSTKPAAHVANPITIGEAGIALIQQFEGCGKRRADGMVEAYPDPGTGADPWTIGWGATGPGIAKGTVWTQGECDARLKSDLALYSAEVAAALGDAPTTQSQFDALVSFHYNTGAIGRSTLTRKHIAGDFAGAAREFDRWVHAGGRRINGLVRRREAEAELYRDSQ